MQYSLVELPDNTTQVDVVMDYQLHGPLAQFSRSGLVREFVRRLTAIFAANLTAGLTQDGAPFTSAKSISVSGLFFSAMKAQLLRLFGR
jgi:carbon-monoxide dehydrogenase small subunit